MSQGSVNGGLQIRPCLRHVSKWCKLGRAENRKNQNINLTQMGSNGTHKNKTHLEKEKNSKVNIRIGKCI